jgi:hypothetical protein
MSNPGINAAAIYETNTPQTIVIDGHDIGTDAPDVSSVTRNSGKGTLKKIADNFDYTMVHDDETSHNTLDGAAHSTLQWQLVMWTFGGVVFLLDKATFTPEEVPQFDPTSEEYPYQLQYTKNAAQQYAKGSDLIRTYRKSQNQSNYANGTTNVSLRIPFPFEGAELTLYNGATNITIEAYDAYSGGASLATTATSSGSGRVSASITLPANTRSVEVSIDDFQDAALVVGNVADPNA